MKELITALVKAQSEFLAIKKTSENPFYKSRYADLETCIEAVKIPLESNGLAVVQLFGYREGKTLLITTLYHTSGQFITGEQVLDVKDPTDPQKVASASTYARRYGLMAILGLAAEDDDGNAAGKTNHTAPATPASTASAAINKAAVKVAEPLNKPKVNLPAEFLSSKYNAEKERTEYTVQVAEGEKRVVYVKKPQVLFEAGQRIEFLEWWISDFKGKSYDFANGVKAVEIDEEIGF
jgi:hypothetical protein